MEFNRWWNDDIAEIYWLEVTDRKNLGEDLNAPQRKDNGEEYYGYSLINEINNGDIIFHYHKDSRAIVATSKASGNVWEDKVLWGAHGTTARGEGVRPYIRPGWRLGLVDFKYIDQQIELKKLRSLQKDIQKIRDYLSARYKNSLYFPFELSNKRELRPTQAYLTKLPKEIVQLIYPIHTETLEHHNPVRTSYSLAIRSTSKIAEPKINYIAELGASYRPADEEAAVSERDPFTVDPALVERANRSHAFTQNKLAEYLRSKDLVPRSPRPGEPNFDIAWLQNETIFVAEIKSLTLSNEEKQLRLGLGQILRYRHLLAQSGKQVQAVMMLEREPSDQSWISLCEALDVLLVWPDTIAVFL